MSLAGRRIIKNAGFLMLSQLITWVLALVLTVMLPRYLGPRAIGQFHISSSLWFILAMLMGFGMDMLLIKEVSRDPTRTGELVGTSFVLRGLLACGVLGLLTLYLTLAGYARDTVLVIWLVGPGFFFFQLEAMCGAALQGLERMEFVSLGAIAGKFVHAGVVITALMLGAGIHGIAILSAVGPFFIFLIQWIALTRLHPVQFKLRWEGLKWMLAASLPYFLSHIFLVVYANLDVLILSLLVDEKTAGWYGVADQFLGTLVFIPVVLTQAVFPALSRQHHLDPHGPTPIVRQSFNWLIVLGVPMGIGLMVVAKPLVVLIYGADFANSGAVLSVLGVVLIGIYLNILLGKYLIATDRQNWWTATMALAALATIPLDLLLVPWSARVLGNGAFAGAISCVVTEAAMLLVGLRLLPKGILRWTELGLAARTIAAGVLMGMVVWVWREAFLAVQVAIGIAVYIPLALAFRVISPTDLAQLANLGGSAVRRVRTRLWGSTI